MSTLDYPVGYKRPPKHTRFMKGKSGNPKGRPKKTGQNSMGIFLEEMMRKIAINEGNKKSKITLERAAIRQLIHKAAKGEMSAIKFFFETRRSFEQVEELITIPQVVFMPPTEPPPFPEPPIYGDDN